MPNYNVFFGDYLQYISLVVKKIKNCGHANYRWKDRIGFTGDIVTIEVKAGELLAFDYRVLHRALSHKGTENRPMLYYTFTKRWFTDAMNFADLPSLNEADTKVEG